MKLGRDRKRGMNGEGRGQKESFFFSSPPPPPFFYYFLLSLQLLRNNSIGKACYAGYKGGERTWPYPYGLKRLCRSLHMSVVQCLFSLVFEYVNERKRIKQRKRWIFYKNEILTKWCVDRNFKVHECHRDRVFFFSSKKTVEPITGERAVLKFQSDKQRCLHEFQMSAWIDQRVWGVLVIVLNSYWKPQDELELTDYWWRMI